MLESWQFLLDLLILLAAALLLGTLAESLRQSAIVGYLAAGMLVGPNALGLVGGGGEVGFFAELGVALLLFSIGLEFSLRRLVKIGPVTYAGGTAQVLLTALAGYAVASALGLGQKAAVVVGMMASLSSTASVVRLLMDGALLDSPFGRNSLGILLLQDIAVVPMVLVTVALGGETSPGQSLGLLGRTLLLGVALFAAFYLLFNVLVPRLLNVRSLSRNRELPVLLAAVMSLGAAWASHAVGVSPAFGAFIAGLLLAESPFAMQIRSDVASLKTILVTLFFAAIGMLVDPLWVAANPLVVGGAFLLVLLVKPAIIFIVTRALGFGTGTALATGVCLSQVGEFSFVLASTAAAAGVIDDHLFRLVVSTTVLTLLVTPYLVRGAPALARRAESLRPLFGGSRLEVPRVVVDGAPAVPDDSVCPQTPLIIIGFGPAGQRAAEGLLPQFGDHLLILDVNPGNAVLAEGLGLRFCIGDGGRRDVLEHLNLDRALAVVVTLPDQDSVRQVMHLCKALAPEVPLFVRSRYHIFKWELLVEGAEAVVDEEAQVGITLAEEVLKSIGS